ncbi:hypothetical protein [Moorena producens]|uniref:hypothetical protein n=1 Tax=Moorena producens TaxID=1155739 RepID=UPI003C720D1D
MTSSLQFLLEAIHQVKDEADLRSRIVPKIGEHFVAKRWGVFFFDQLPRVSQKLLDAKREWGKPRQLLMGETPKTALAPQDRAASLQESLQIALSIDHNPVLPKKNLGH